MLKHTFFASTLVLGLCAGALQAQEPPKEAPKEAVKEPTLAEKLKSTAPAVEKLLATFEFDQAFKLSETLPPTTITPYDGSSEPAAFRSSIAHYEYAQAFFVAFKAADAAGQWEKAEQYVKKAQEIAKANKTESEKALTAPLKLWNAVVSEAKQIVDPKAELIAELKKKWKDNTATNQELNDLDGYLIEERKVEKGGEQVRSLQYALDRGTKYADSYDSYVKYIGEKLKDFEDKIAEYAHAKGDKVKWAEAIASAPKYFDAFSQDDKLRFLHRLKVMAPESAKVQRALDIAQGKPVAPEPKAKPAPKKKAK